MRLVTERAQDRGRDRVTYSIPFTPDSRVIELGGGTCPMFRPNIDVRPGPAVDLVASFEHPLPIPDAECDGIFSKFAFEHVSWRTVDGLMAETHRILKPGGVLVLVLPNLLEQMRLSVEKGDAGEWDWDNGVACRIFGDLDYPENSHKAGWCPESVCRALRNAGFASVFVVPFGEIRTDMVVEARKAA